ncbi:aspartic proteinase nepenthesin-2-like [Cryptomeria japonica]|uniref:aspartic proteinase nepenthesin-2-like n=1 Tax=Cryptomeria japonica TaxID=3369 RepID=UPI0027DA9785|nr:aspartic proteinase nepenthesin-2-like [Cryptomeria japonica]
MASPTKPACSEEVHGGPHLERNSSIGRLKRMEASIKAVQTHVGGAFSSLTSRDRAQIMSIGIRTPTRTFKGLVDTASDLIWFYCDPFNHFHIYPTFYQSDSSTYERVPCSSSFCSALGNSTCAPDCRYSHLYSQSWITRGDLSFETFNVGNHSFGGVAFGCSNETYGDGLVIADGVLGLGRGKLSLI